MLKKTRKMNNKSPLIANLHNESERTKKMKNEEN
jgi:hypothetical protein